MYSIPFYQLLFSCCIICSVVSLPDSNQCPANEYPVECVNRCQKCEDRSGNCGQGQWCIPGCNCLPGFWRDSKGKCIPESSCPLIWPSLAQCPPFERQVECIDQCRSCKWVNQRCSQGAVCIPGCDCFPGWRRNYQNKCIPENQCPGVTPNPMPTPPLPPCGMNEIQVPCIDKCQKCEDRKGGCFQTLECTPGCNCLPGFWRNKRGVCIPEFYCPALPPVNRCPPGEIPVDCANQCQKCADRNGPCIPTGPCKPGCNCPSGYWRNDQGKCIPANQCPPILPQCGLNEFPAPYCANQCQKCEDRFGGCVPKEPCKPGCDCLGGYWRNKQGKCIPAFQCPPVPAPADQPVPCGQNEYPVPCINRCDKCEDRKGGCVQIALCTPGCDCVPTFWRNKRGQCIPEYQCPPVPSPGK